MMTNLMSSPRRNLLLNPSKYEVQTHSDLYGLRAKSSGLQLWDPSPVLDVRHPRKGKYPGCEGQNEAQLGALK